MIFTNTGIISIQSIPEGAEIHLDGNPIRTTSGNVAKAPLILSYVPEGPHWLTLKMPGYFDEIRLVGSITNMQHNVYIVMKPIP